MWRKKKAAEAAKSHIWRKCPSQGRIQSTPFRANNKPCREWCRQGLGESGCDEDEVGRAPSADSIRGLRLGSGLFTARDIHRRNWAGLADRDAVGSAIEVLETTHHCRAIPANGPQGGRPSAAYSWHPA